MAALPFALSVSHFVNSVGAKAGFAAIIGLAILVLLFFAQARETATLRDRAAESEEHVQQLELRIAQLARGTAPVATGTPAPAPPPVGVQRAPAAPAVAAAAAPAGSKVVPPPATTRPSTAPLGAPAGVGAPALSAATRLIPGVEAGAISIRATGASTPASTAAATGPAAPPAPAARAVGAPASGGPPAGPPSTGAAVMTPPGPAPSTAAGGANGGAGTRVPPPAPAPVPAPVPAPPPASVRPAQPPPRGQIRPAGTRPVSGGPRRPGPPPGRSGISATALVIAGLLAVAAVVVVLLLVTGGGGGSSSSSSSSASNNASSGKHHRSGRSHVALTPSAITVSVLNGTSTPNLARAVSNRLGSSGYKPGRVTNAVDQGLTSTIVGYLPGDRPAALLVAKALGLGQASVQAVDPGNESVACPSSSSCSTKVVVSVGGDLASSSPTTSASTT
jgi:LytR cell envelope-related transcriptional attenuator